jgi:hypothetical protein
MVLCDAVRDATTAAKPPWEEVAVYALTHTYTHIHRHTHTYTHATPAAVPPWEEVAVYKKHHTESHSITQHLSQHLSQHRTAPLTASLIASHSITQVPRGKRVLSTGPSERLSSHRANVGVILKRGCNLWERKHREQMINEGRIGVKRERERRQQKKSQRGSIGRKKVNEGKTTRWRGERDL